MGSDCHRTYAGSACMLYHVRKLPSIDRYRKGLMSPDSAYLSCVRSNAAVVLGVSINRKTPCLHILYPDQNICLYCLSFEMVSSVSLERKVKTTRAVDLCLIGRHCFSLSDRDSHSVSSVLICALTSLLLQAEFLFLMCGLFLHSPLLKH